MRTAILGVVIALVAGGASAQVTKCGPEFGKWVCRTTPGQQPQPDIMAAGQRAFDQSYARTDRVFRDAAERQRAAPVDPLEADRQRLEAIRIVRGYIDAKLCADAQRVAFDYFGEKGKADAAELCPN